MLSPISFDHRTNKGHITEFVMVLSMLLILLFPFINLLGMLTAYATVCLVSQQAISQASKQQNYNDALKSLKEESSQLLNSPFAAFAKVTPVKGYKHCGSDLFVEATNFLDSSTKTFGPNTPVPPPLDPQTFVYEYAIKSSFEAQPLISMSEIPLFSQIPGLGKPYNLNYHCTKSVEHVKGLAVNPGLTTAYAGGSMSFPGPLLQTQGPTSTQANVGGWNHPDIYEAVKAAGQKVLAQDVIIIQANNGHWTPTSIDVPEGAKVWIDYRADGEWTTMPDRGTCNAAGAWQIKGYDYSGGRRRDPFDGRDGVMLGKVGENGRVSVFGDRQWNKPLNGTGKLFLGACDGFSITERSINMTQNIFYPWYFQYADLDKGELAYIPLSRDSDPPLQGYADNKGTMEVRVVISR